MQVILALQFLKSKKMKRGLIHGLITAICFYLVIKHFEWKGKTKKLPTCIDLKRASFDKCS